MCAPHHQLFKCARSMLCVSDTELKQWVPRDRPSLGGLHLFRVAPPEKFIATKWPVMTSANSVSEATGRVGQAGR